MLFFVETKVVAVLSCCLAKAGSFCGECPNARASTGETQYFDLQAHECGHKHKMAEDLRVPPRIASSRSTRGW
jgi:hypothetical protein